MGCLLSTEIDDREHKECEILIISVDKKLLRVEHVITGSL